MKYKMKIDNWMKILLILLMTMFVPLMFIVPPDEIGVMVLSTGLMVVFVLPLFYAYIQLEDDEIIISMYFFKQRIKYENIKSLMLCQNWKSSASLSYKRIEIKVHNKGFILGTTYIGPENRDEVFEELQRRCRHLEK